MGEVVIGARSASGDDEPEGVRPANAPGSGGPDPGGRDPGDRDNHSTDGDPEAASGNGPAADGAGTGDGEGDDAGSGASGAGGDRKQRKKGSFWKELPLLLGIALVLALIIKTFFVQAFSIPSESMENTIKVGDRVLVDKFTPWFGSDPERGEVVVFRDPGGWLGSAPEQSSNPVVRGLQKGLSWVGLMPSTDEKDLIKRVIGVGGDTVACCDPDGRLTVNGVPLDEPYLKPGVAPSRQEFSVTVPKGRVWLMGDNRSNSLDSRSHMDEPGQGTVSNDQIIGRAFIVVWPLDRFHTLGVPGTFGQSGIGGAAAAGTPMLLGLAGAVPLVLLRRRLRDARDTA